MSELMRKMVALVAVVTFVYGESEEFCAERLFAIFPSRAVFFSRVGVSIAT